MAIETLFDLAKDDAAAFEKEKKLAQADAAQAMKDVSKAQDDLSTAADDLAKLQDAAALTRREIAATTVAADGAALFVKLDKNTSETRAKQAEMLDLQETISDGQARTAAAQSQAQAAAAAQKAAEDAKDAAEQRDKTHTAWKNAAKGATLSNVPTNADVQAGDAKTAKEDAEKVLDSAKKVTTPQGDVNGDIPTKLFAQGHDRRAKRATRIGKAAKHAVDAEDALAVKLAAAGLGGEIEQKRIAFERTEEAVRDFAINGKERYDRALARLAEVKNGPRINGDERARLTTLTTKGEAAILLEAAVVSAQDALDTQRDAVEGARRAAVAADPTKDPDDVTAVKTELNKLPALQATLDGAETAYTTAARSDLDAWEAAVPDSTWALFEAYESALETLAELKAIGDLATTLPDQLDQDEKAYVQALAAERANERVVIALSAFSQGRRERASVASQSAPARLLGALRGDD